MILKLQSSGTRQLKFLFLLFDELLVRNVLHKDEQNYDNNLIGAEKYKINEAHAHTV